LYHRRQPGDQRRKIDIAEGRMRSGVEKIELIGQVPVVGGAEAVQQPLYRKAKSQQPDSLLIQFRSSRAAKSATRELSILPT